MEYRQSQVIPELFRDNALLQRQSLDMVISHLLEDSVCASDQVTNSCLFAVLLDQGSHGLRSERDAFA